MNQRTLGILRKIGLATVEVVMVLAVLLVLAVVALMLRLQAGSLDIAFAKSFLQTELSEVNPAIAVEMDHVLLEWSQIDSRPRITLQNVRLINRADNRTMLGMDSLGLSLARGRLLLGQVVPRAVFIDRPLLTLVRTADRKFTLGLDDDATPDTEMPEAQSEFLFNLLDTLSQDVDDMPADWPMKSLRMVRVTGARMMVEDYAVQQSWLIPRLDLMFRKGRDGLLATSTLWIEQDRGDANIMLDAAYDPDTKTLLARLNVQSISTPFLATKFPELAWLQGQDIPLQGTVELAMDSGLSLHTANFNLQALTGQVNLPDLYDAPLAFQNMNVKASFNRADRIFHIEDVSVQVGDLAVSAQADVSGNPDVGFTAPITLRIPDLPQASVAPLWPKVLAEKSITPWVLDHLSGGRVHDAEIKVSLKAQKSMALETDEAVAGEMDVTVDALTADFGIENMDIDYRAPLMKVKAANGSGHFDIKTDTLSFKVNKAALGDMAVSEGTVIIDTVTGEGVGTADIDLRLTGPLKTVFEYIRAEPIEAGRDFPVPLEKIAGDADLKIGVDLPTAEHVKEEDVKVTVDGTLNNVVMPGLVSGLDVAGTGLVMKMAGNEVSVEGQGKISGRDMKFRWAQFLSTAGQPYNYQVVAETVIDPELRAHFGADLADWVAGSAPAKITYTEKQDGHVAIDLNIDATPATLMVKPFKYEKKPAVPATASARVNLAPGGVLRDIQNLSITTPDAKVDNAVLNFRQAKEGPQVSGGRFPNARLGATRGTLEFTQGTDDILRLNVTGQSFDARPFLDNDGKAGQQPAQDGPAIVASVQVPVMLTNKDQSIKNAKVDLEMDRRSEVTKLDVDATVGKGTLTFRYKPDSTGRMVLTIDSNDAGAALKAFGYYENMVGGTLRVDGQPPQGLYRGKLQGHALISNFRVVNAPVLARLLSAMSLPGIMELLGSDGIDFTKLEGNFVWEQRYGGSLMTILDGRTAGSAMGLTFQGTLDEAKQTMDIKGTIVPVSMVNDLISSIPLIGDVITGGGGAVFAATYTIRGPTSDPTTTVNPLAVLAPGFLRKLFFE
ncbi:YhdP family protein [Micavibrio aeruginosavorus]|uniref:YhdP family protein n=1 Tax=Micavibrio aeruginosavorus TaxID=349221 RepID=UPI001F353822|nr:DUF3971 domain-containing protein [Micavibrio aeruginosavorus]